MKNPSGLPIIPHKMQNAAGGSGAGGAGKSTTAETIDQTAQKSNPADADFDNLPAEMRNASRWLVWRSEPNANPSKKPRKVPYYPNGKRRSGTLDSPADVAQFGTFDEAVRALEIGNYTGLGFTLGADGTGNCWQGVDLDGMPNRPELSYVADDLPGYTETSPSGNGMHAIGYGKPFQSMGSNSTGIETYSSGRFFTVTAVGSGIHAPVCLADFVEKRLKPMHSGKANATQATDAAIAHTCEAITPKQISELRSALLHLRADDRDLWIRIGHALRMLGDVGRGLFMDWSETSDKFDPQADARTWETFKPTKTSYQAIFAEAQRAGWVNPASKAAQGDTTPLPQNFDLAGFSLNGESTAMKQKMLADVFVVGHLALLGQITFWYAQPNAGKTLLLLWMLIDGIKSGRIKAEDIFYINADDNHKGLTFKTSLAELWKFFMLAPGYNGFKPEKLAEYLDAMIKNDTARGKIIILDTTKKFADIMDKRNGTKFGEAVRQFAMHGGTVIGLCHVNKHRDNDGQLVYAGTADLVDDCDCAYTLDVVTNDKGTSLRTVRFTNIKNRGDVSLEALYEYSFAEEMSYQDKLDSVRSLSDAEKEYAVKRRVLEDRLARNKMAIEAIKHSIRDGIINKTLLIKSAMDLSALSKNKIVTALKEHEGESVADYQFWHVNVADKNAHVYVLNLFC